MIVTSYEEGITKPSEEIFNILAARLNLNPTEIVMSDDREANVEALVALGFNAILYQGLDHFRTAVDSLLG